MEIQNDSKTYELAYHLNPDLEEVTVRAHMQELGGLVVQNGGSLIREREPKKIHLSYPIKNKNYAYFGLFDFTAQADTIEKINTQMKLQNGILRYLLLKRPAEGKELRILGERRTRTRMIKTHEPVAAEAPKAPKEKTKEETEQLEQEIEKVIEGL